MADIDEKQPSLEVTENESIKKDTVGSSSDSQNNIMSRISQTEKRIAEVERQNAEYRQRIAELEKQHISANVSAAQTPPHTDTFDEYCKEHYDK